MNHYQRLGLPQDASHKDIRLAYLQMIATTNPQDRVALAAIEAAYRVLSDGVDRMFYDDQLEAAEGEGLALQNRPFPKQRPYRLWPNPEAFNHYEYINRLFALRKEDESYLVPGQALGPWNRNRLFWQLHTVSGRIHAESEGWRRVIHRTAEQQKRLELLECNEKKIGLCIHALATGRHEKCLYDIALGSAIVPPTEDMRDIAQRIGGWEKMAAYLLVNPRLSSSSAIFDLRKAGYLNPANFKRLMALVDNESQLYSIGSIIRKLADENLVNQANFAQVIAHRQFALSLSNGLGYLEAAHLLEQSSFEALLEAGQYADAVGSSWRTLKAFNLLNQANREIVAQCAMKNIGVLLLKCFRHLEEQRLFTPEDGLDFLWTGDTEELQALSLRIDAMFAYGISLLCHDKDKAQTVFLLALDLKKSLKTHYAKPLEEQREIEQQFRTQFKQCLHSQDALMAEHRAYWQVIVANIAIAFTGVGLLALGVHYAKTGHCFFALTHREQLRDTIEESHWLQERRITV